jgi:hypothetical protein
MTRLITALTAPSTRGRTLLLEKRVLMLIVKSIHFLVGGFWKCREIHCTKAISSKSDGCDIKWVRISSVVHPYFVGIAVNGYLFVRCMQGAG